MQMSDDLDPIELVDDDLGSERGSRRKKSKGDLADEHVQRIAAEIDSTEYTQDFTDADLPSPDLLTPAPAKNADVGRRELDAAGQRLMAALRTFKVEGETRWPNHRTCGHSV